MPETIVTKIETYIHDEFLTKKADSLDSGEKRNEILDVIDKSKFETKKSFCDCAGQRETFFLNHYDEILFCDCGESPNPSFEWKWDTCVNDATTTLYEMEIGNKTIIKEDQTVFLPGNRFCVGEKPLCRGEYFWEIKILNQLLIGSRMVSFCGEFL